jgi:hypothetical protein
MLMSVFANACDLYKLNSMPKHFVAPLSVLLLDVPFVALLLLLEEIRRRDGKPGQKIEERRGVSLGSFVVVPQVKNPWHKAISSFCKPPMMRMSSPMIAYCRD